MRHRKHSVKFGRQRSHYKATLKLLVSGLIISKGITTTKVKAKEASRLADKLVTLAKAGDVTARRRAYSILGSRDLVSILFNDIAPLFKERKGGYTRVMLTRRRRGDNAQMAILEFVEKPKPKPSIEPAKKKSQKEEKPASEPKIKAEKKPEPKIKAEKKSEPKIKAEKKPEPKIKAEKKPELKPKPSIEKPKPEKPKEEKKEEPKKVVEPVKKPEQLPQQSLRSGTGQAKEPEKKPSFFKKLFGKKK